MYIATTNGVYVVLQLITQFTVSTNAAITMHIIDIPRDEEHLPDVDYCPNLHEDDARGCHSGAQGEGW